MSKCMRNQLSIDFNIDDIVPSIQSKWSLLNMYYVKAVTLNNIKYCHNFSRHFSKCFVKPDRNIIVK